MKKRPSISFTYFGRNKTLSLKTFLMRSANCKLSICLAFILKFATLYSFLEINIGYGARVALLFGLLEQLVGKIILLPVQDCTRSCFKYRRNRQKGRNVRRNTLTSTPTKSTFQPRFEFCTV